MYGPNFVVCNVFLQSLNSMADESSVQESSSSEVTGGSTIELNVKTLDSQTYTFRVEKNVTLLHLTIHACELSFQL